MHCRLPNIDQLFTPLQPSTEKTQEGICYSMTQPALPLQKYIYSYWEFYTQQPLSQPYHHRVVADGCIAIIIDMLNPENNFIRGFITSYTEYQFKGSFHYIGVCFYPSAFPILFNHPAGELTNQFEQLNNVLPRMAASLTQLFDHKMTMQKVKDTFDTYFLRALTQTTYTYDGRFFNAVDLILKSHGSVTVQTDLNTGISPRQLRRLFDFYIGETPKTFCTIVRFQSLINSRPSAACIRHKKYFTMLAIMIRHILSKNLNVFTGSPLLSPCRNSLSVFYNAVDQQHFIFAVLPYHLFFPMYMSVSQNGFTLT